jgi:hypothetical protein
MENKVEENSQKQKPLIHSLVKDSLSSVFTKKLFVIIIVAVVLGGLSGYLLRGTSSGSIDNVMSEDVNPSEIQEGEVFGSDDLDTFKDTAVGDLKGGGVNGEGQFHLVRPGGDSQNVYLTSANVDLSKFIGKKVKVWGETQQAQYAGWLMNVGRIEVVK